MNSESLDRLRKENDQLCQKLEHCKQIEQALRDSEERYRLLAENVSDIIWTMDMNFRYTYLSPSAERQSGYTHEAAMAMTLEETFTPASVEAIQKAFSEELALERSRGRGGSRSRTLELEAYNKDGSTTWVEVVASFLRDAEGQPTGILGITRNIAARRRAEEALKRQEEYFRALIERSSDFVIVLNADMGHLGVCGSVPLPMALLAVQQKETAKGWP